MVLDGVLDELQSGGVTHAYLVASTNSLVDRGPILVLPCDDAAAVKALADQLLSMLPKFFDFEAVRDDSIVLVGPRLATQRLANLPTSSVQRSDLIATLSAQRSTDHFAVFALPTDARRVLALVWPDHTPRSISIELSPSQLAADIQQIELGWSIPPQSSVNLVLRCVNDAAADRTHSAFINLLNTLSINEPQIGLSLEENRVVARMDSDMANRLIGEILEPLRRSNYQAQNSNNLKIIMLGMHNYSESFQTLPTNRGGDPPISWRVAILPFIDQAALFRTYNQTKSFDAPENALLTETRVPLYLRPGDPATSRTRYRIPDFPGSAAQFEGPLKFSDITDGTSQTIAVIEAPESASVDWTDPAPWKISAEDPVSDIFGNRDSIIAAFFDGSVRVLYRDQTDNRKLTAMLTIAGGELIDD